MKRIIIMTLAMMIWYRVGGFGEVADGTPQFVQKGSQKMRCAVCGVKEGDMQSRKGRMGTTRAVAGSDFGEQDKCPVCGMFVYRHPRWAAFIYYEKSGKLEHFAFDGVKDLMKFYFEPNKWGDYGNIEKHIKKIVVRDYCTLKPVWAKAAWYVVGSDVYGPTGNELIPFETEETAENFTRDHHGRKILRFDEITKELVCKLDE